MGTTDHHPLNLWSSTGELVKDLLKFGYEFFLGNSKNKPRPINLKTDVNDNGYSVCQAVAHVDTTLVRTTLQSAGDGEHVSIAGADTDLLALLVNLTPRTSSPSNVILGPNGEADVLQESLGDARELVLFAHAKPGSDTTSAFFNKGKTAAINLVRNNKTLVAAIQVFNQPRASKQNIAAAGEKFILALYNGSKRVALDE